MPAPERDVVTIGRVSVDLYGQQIGGRLEDMGSFAKSVGGSPANMAIGAARLGLKAGFISRVGDEAMGRFIREQMEREGVDARFLRTDSKRLTALVLLGVRDDKTFPLIFYRENCADSALDETDIDEAYVAGSRAVVVTGTHFALANTDAAQRKAMRIARDAGRRVVFDIDYRPNLWGLAGHGAGEERYIASGRVSEHLQGILPLCDLIVGTEEELRVAGGEEETLSAVRAVRRLSEAIIVLKRGPMGCVIYPGAIPAQIEDGISGPGFPVEVYNVLGAGDAFMAGFLSGWLRDAPLEECARRANACGAIAVSRLLCSPEYPSRVELEHFLEKGSKTSRLRGDATLNHIHWATATRRAGPKRLVIVENSGRAMAPLLRIGRWDDFNVLLAKALLHAAHDETGFGLLAGNEGPRGPLYSAEATPLWVARRWPHWRMDDDAGTSITEWPVTHTVACYVFNVAACGSQRTTKSESLLLQLSGAARALSRSLLVDISTITAEVPSAAEVEQAMQRLYEIEIRPDWWVVPDEAVLPNSGRIGEIIAEHDPWCCGVLRCMGVGRGDLLPEPISAGRCRGIVLSSDVIAAQIEGWASGALSDEVAVEQMAACFGRFKSQLSHQPMASAGSTPP